MSVRTFEVNGPPRVVFGPGTESRVADELVALGAERVLMVSTSRRAGADRVASALGARCVGVFDGAEAQVPLEVAEAARALARERNADWVVAHGGGTPIGVAKAVALEVDVSVGAVPTTYAGSEMTEIYGITAGGEKTTGRDPRVRPRLVVFDPELVVGMPPAIATPSLVNALAHSIEGLYADNASDSLKDQAQQSIASIVGALRQSPGGLSLEGAAEAQYGAYLAAGVLNEASMALHHKLAHVLGGSFGTPHAETHTALLSYTLAHNAAGAPDAVRRLREVLEDADPVAALWDLLHGLDLPIRLSKLGFALNNVGQAVEVALQRPYANPIPLTREGLTRTLQDAVLGRRPSLDVGRLALDGVEGHHAGLDAAYAGPELGDARKAVLVVHGRGGAAETMLQKIAHRPDDVAWIAVQAADNTWYPKGYREVEVNGPFRDSAFTVLDAAWREATAVLEPKNVVVLGWSQGACLVLSWLAARQVRPGALVAWTGAAMPTYDTYRELNGLPVYVGTADQDPWVQLTEVQQTVEALNAGGAVATLTVEPTTEHGIRDQDQAALEAFLR